MIYPAKQISVSILCAPNEVYDFVSNPKNLPRWASGLSGTALVQNGQDWIADSPMGKVKVRFTEKNNLGVLDHDVTLPSGEINHNPLRVSKNGSGSEIVFTLYRLPGVLDAAFDLDAATVQADLEKLKSILENKH